MFHVSLLHRDRSKSPRRPNPHTLGMLDSEGRPIDMADELSMVGYTEDTTVEHVFEKNGETRSLRSAV